MVAIFQQTHTTLKQKKKSTNGFIPFCAFRKKEMVIQMKKCCIFCSVTIENYDYIKDILKPDDYIICADGGIYHAIKLGLTPNLIAGDFDSFSGEIPFDCEIIRLNQQKDETDTLFCIKKAIDLGYKQIIVFGAIGKRLDHTFANIQCLEYGKENGANIELIDEKSRFFVIKDEEYIGISEQDKIISVFSLSEKSYDVSLEGLKYQLCNVVLENKYPIGISNEFCKENYKIKVKKGSLLIIISTK